MADYSPFHPDEMPGADQGTAVPQAPQANPQGMAEQWREFLSNDDNRAALLSFGAALASPMQWGQTGVGHLAQALGHAGQTSSNRAALDIKETEAESKQIQREQTGNAATARAQVAEANARTAQERASIAQQTANSQQLLRESQIEKNNATYELLQLKAALYPQDQKIQQEWKQAQAQRLRAQAGLYDARTEAVPLETGIKERNATSREAVAASRVADSETKRKAQEGTLTLGTQRLEQQGQQAAAKDTADLRNKYIKARDAYNADRLKPKEAPPFQSYEEWVKGVPQTAKPQAPVEGGGPQRRQFDPAPPTEQRIRGTIYETPQGPLRWNPIAGDPNPWERL